MPVIIERMVTDRERLSIRDASNVQSQRDSEQGNVNTSTALFTIQIF